MKAPIELTPPNNWQDFENLCHKLWSEIWLYPETKMNGRLGQRQKGVDIYGIPKGERSYYGIQCKRNRQFPEKKLTETILNKEIAEAKGFEPKLYKLYFATTALRDAKIDEYIRKLNLDHIQKGLFEVHVFFWEDIVDRILSNNKTYNWYVKNINYHTEYDAILTFDNDLTEIECNPLFKKINKQYLYVPKDPWGYNLNREIAKNILKDHMQFSNFIDEYNFSFSKFRLKLKNTGGSTIEDYQVQINMKGDIDGLSLNNVHYRANGFPDPLQITNVHIKDNNFLIFEPSRNNSLVSEEIIHSDEIFVKPPHTTKTIIIEWKLLSRDYKNNGELKINFKPKYRVEKEEIVVHDRTKVKKDSVEYRDYISSINPYFLESVIESLIEENEKD